jgi:hypothetical protein
MVNGKKLEIMVFLGKTTLITEIFKIKQMAFKMRGMSFKNSPLKQDKDITGHGGSKTPDVLYKSDGTAVKTSQIDEELLDSTPNWGPKGKFVNYTAEDGTKIKYHYKKP